MQGYQKYAHVTQRSLYNLGMQKEARVADLFKEDMDFLWDIGFRAAALHNINNELAGFFSLPQNAHLTCPRIIFAGIGLIVALLW